jgi:hypothetical protein
MAIRKADSDTCTFDLQNNNLSTTEDFNIVSQIGVGGIDLPFFETAVTEGPGTTENVVFVELQQAVPARLRKQSTTPLTLLRVRLGQYRLDLLFTQRA